MNPQTQAERIERRAQQRVKADKQVRIGSRKPTDAINLTRLKRWHERLREQAIRRERMEMRNDAGAGNQGCVWGCG